MVINYSPIIGLELRFGRPNVVRHLKTVVPVVGGASRPFKSPLSLSALGGIIRRRSSINKIHYMRQNSRSCKTESATEGVFQSYFLRVALLRLRQALRLFGRILLQTAGDEHIIGQNGRSCQAIGDRRCIPNYFQTVCVTDLLARSCEDLRRGLLCEPDKPTAVRSSDWVFIQLPFAYDIFLY
jgi:hypothetical protein